MKYNLCGNSGLRLPEISLGLWHNFGDVDDFNVATSMIQYAFDNGVTHFDLANNYGPPPGSAEINFGKILAKELKGHRDELIISSKAGHLMWDGPYGDGGSRKYIMASIDQSLKRTGLEYFDIFYSHRYDPETPVEETMQALIDIVRQGKALYVGISKYPIDKLTEAYEILKSQHVPCLIYQDKYSMLERTPEKEHMSLNEKYGVGFISFSPLAQGLLTTKYLNGIPENSRAHKAHGFLQESEVTTEVIKKVSALNDLAAQRGQTLAEMALAWQFQNKHVTSVIVGTSSLNQLKDNLKATDNTHFASDELALIENILK
ncbi:aldo/keto reductase [Dysgonomonas sp. Marseille-P4361]|uniref:aldo/keto reductase n=1 Tax=Dysgonomonas sp. Marseille-P4361 TaxID=2161820 RepID=UPI000D562D8F|nr:aldo/keto reductase [Dysgonomonas sp. Marseille-P4361]